MSNIDKINVNGTEYGIEGVDGDSKDDTTTFTSSDVADGSATTWTSVNILASGEKHSSIFGKVSQMFKNVRYLYKLLGTTDFSGLGTDISGALNNLEDIIVKGVETSSTASQAYAVNEYMIYNKKLYKVKAAIASGATITVGTNIESANTNVGNELTSLRSSLANKQTHLNIEHWSSTITITADANYMATYGVYIGSKVVSSFTNYDSQKWSKRLFAFVEIVRPNGDGNVCYPGWIDNDIATVKVSSVKALTVTVKITVVYPDLS